MKKYKGLYKELDSKKEPKLFIGKTSLSLKAMTNFYESIENSKSEPIMVAYFDKDGNWQECDIEKFNITMVTGK